MRILSKFPDYYDIVAHIYGGGDPKIRYERRDLPSNMKIKFPSIMAPLSSLPYMGGLYTKYDTHTLIVGKRVYTIFSLERYSHGDFGPPKYFLPDAKHEIINKWPQAFRDWKKHGPRILYHESSHAIDLCKRVGQPVFWIRQYYKGGRKWTEKSEHFITIYKEIPRLHEIKNFVKFYPSEQIYQDISYMLGNLMRTPPDENPPVQVDDKTRFAKKGFDAKTSFRGKQT